LCERLREAGVRTEIENQHTAEADGILAGKQFVLTGTLPTMTREHAKALIESQGGRVLSSVSKKNDYVLAGADPGSKLERATQLGVAIIDETAFKKMLG